MVFTKPELLTLSCTISILYTFNFTVYRISGLIAIILTDLEGRAV
jgi:hypothetical protein